MVKKTFLLKLTIILTFTLFLAACELPTTDLPPTPTTEAIYTLAAQTIAAQITRTAEAIPDSPTAELPTQPPVVTNTPVPPTMTASPSDTPEPIPTNTLTPETTPTPVPIFEDDFSNTDIWYVAEEEDFSFAYVDGRYQITNDLLNAAVWSIREQEFGDMRLEVDVYYAGGPEDGYFGVVCRFSDEGENYYALVIGMDGFYGIAKMEDGEFEFIEQGQDEGDVLKRGDASNRVRADCVGNTLTLFANGEELLQVEDDTFNSGIVGLVAGTRFSGPGLKAQFDNFAIFRP